MRLPWPLPFCAAALLARRHVFAFAVLLRCHQLPLGSVLKKLPSRASVLRNHSLNSTLLSAVAHFASTHDRLTLKTAELFAARRNQLRVPSTARVPIVPIVPIVPNAFAD
jgi:hypothetical protein